MDDNNEKDNRFKQFRQRILALLAHGLNTGMRLISRLRRTLPGEEGVSVSSDIRAAFQHINPRRVYRIAALIIVGAYVLSGLYMVRPGEAAVVTRFGQVVNPKVSEGLRYRLPWPFEKETVVNVSEVRRESVGLASAEPEHPKHLEKPGKLQVLSGDTNILDYEVIVQYQVLDPVQYLFAFDYAPYQLVRDAVRAAVTSVSTDTAVDDILTSGRQSVLDRLQKETQTILDTYQTGLRIVSVNFQKAYPPDEVADAFRDVSSAREDKDKSINEAEGYKNSVIPEARGQAEKLVTEATSTAQALVNEARGSAAGFNEILAEYRTNSGIYGEKVTRFRLYLERMEQIFPRIKTYVVKPGEKVNLKLLENGSSVDVFPPQSP